MIDKMEVGTVEFYTKVRKLDNNENTRMPMWLWKRIERNRYIGAKVRWGEIKLRQMCLKEKVKRGRKLNLCGYNGFSEIIFLTLP